MSAAAEDSNDGESDSKVHYQSYRSVFSVPLRSHEPAVVRAAASRLLDYLPCSILVTNKKDEFAEKKQATTYFMYASLFFL